MQMNDKQDDKPCNGKKMRRQRAFLAVLSQQLLLADEGRGCARLSSHPS
jgi:hypothetical protein